MTSRKNKKLHSPAIVHSEKGEGFTNFFKEQADKVRYSLQRVENVTSPYITSPLFRSNYDTIFRKQL